MSSEEHILFIFSLIPKTSNIDIYCISFMLDPDIGYNKK